MDLRYSSVARLSSFLPSFRRVASGRPDDGVPSPMTDGATSTLGHRADSRIVGWSNRVEVVGCAPVQICWGDLARSCPRKRGSQLCVPSCSRSYVARTLRKAAALVGNDGAPGVPRDGPVILGQRLRRKGGPSDPCPLLIGREGPSRSCRCSASVIHGRGNARTTIAIARPRVHKVHHGYERSGHRVRC